MTKDRIIYLLFICLSSSLLIWQIYVFLMYMVFKVVLFNVICLKVMYNLDNLKSWAQRTSLANLLYHKLSFLNIHKDIQLNVSLNTYLAVVTSEVSCVSLSIQNQVTSCTVYDVQCHYISLKQRNTMYLIKDTIIYILKIHMCHWELTMLVCILRLCFF